MNFIHFKKSIRQAKRGIALLDIMLGMAIVAGILVGVIQMARMISDRMKVSNTQTILRTVKTGIEQYKMDLGHYPARIDELVNPPADQKDRQRWQGPYVPTEYAREGAIKDAYGNELDYVFDAGKHTYEVKSWGKNGTGSDVGNIFAD